MKLKYNIKGHLYEVAQLGLVLGGSITGFGIAPFLLKSGKMGLEEIVGSLVVVGSGLLVAGSSLYYRQKCRTNQKNIESSQQLDKE